MSRVSEISTEACGAFSKEFPLAYRDCVVDAVKEKRRRQQQQQQQTSAAAQLPTLLTAPLPTQVIKSGELYKMGEINTSWKKRVFTALNAADNYAITYADEGSVPKGRISCFGYHVEGFTEDESCRYGVGFKLKHYDESRRCWVFRVEDEAELDEWMEVFSNACRHAVQDMSADPLQVQAFKTAFRVTRNSYGYFGSVVLSGTECEMLENMINQILSRELLEHYLASSSEHMSPAMKKNLVASVEKDVERVVRPTVASTWRSNVAICQMRSTFQRSVEDNIDTIITVESSIVNAVAAQIRDITEPVLSDMHEKLAKGLNCFGESITRAFEEAVRGFHGEIHNRISLLEADPTKLDDEISKMDKAVAQLMSGPLGISQQILWKMFTEDLAGPAEMELFDPAGITTYQIYVLILDNLRTLVRNAVFTFGEQMKSQWDSGKGTHILEIINDTLSKLNSDAKRHFREDVLSVLREMIESSVQEMLFIPVAELMLNHTSKVQKNLYGMLNVTHIGESVVREHVEQFLLSLVDGMALDSASRFNMVALQLMEVVPSS